MSTNKCFDCGTVHQCGKPDPIEFIDIADVDRDGTVAK